MEYHFSTLKKQKNKDPQSLESLTITGSIEVVIYNFLPLITIDTNTNQFITVYHIFNKLQ